MAIPTDGMRLGRGRRAAPRVPELREDLTVGVVIALDDPAAEAAGVVGAKAANLAVAAAARLPVLSGFAVPVTVVARAVAAGGFGHLAREELGSLHEAWRKLTGDGARAVVARSSAVREDAAGSSMAGRFRSELDVRGWKPFLAALDAVAYSAEVVALDGSQSVEAHDMAVLVQLFLPVSFGGVLFGVDPVAGRANRFVLATVRGGPEALVSGIESGSHQVLTRRGRAIQTTGAASVAPAWPRRRQLATLARRAAAVFGAPQDLEWGVDNDGHLWLFQSRPVTAVAGRPSKGSLLGPGPVAETFPDPLGPLEQDLWLVPLREGIAHAIDLTAAVPKRKLAASPVAVAVGGRLAVDLRLIGAAAERQSFVTRLDPRPGARRLRAAWRIGRLRRALPALARDLVETIDRDLNAIPSLTTRTDEELLAVLHGTRRALLALHGQEMLAGLLMRSAQPDGTTGASLALHALHEARIAGVSEAEIISRHPEVLSLVPPAVRSATMPPPTVALADASRRPAHEGIDEVAELRETLRMRARWVQELAALCAWELGQRLEAHGLLDDRSDVRRLDLRRLEAAIMGHRPTLAPEECPAPPLPAMFHLDAGGRIVPFHAGSARAGQGAGGGRHEGTVVHDSDDVAAAAADGPVVLVTSTLHPSLAALLPNVVGLIAETGSVLSHLAILARELGVATVVGVTDARTKYPVSTKVVIDGSTGAIEATGP